MRIVRDCRVPLATLTRVAERTANSCPAAPSPPAQRHDSKLIKAVVAHSLDA